MKRGNTEQGRWDVRTLRLQLRNEVGESAEGHIPDGVERFRRPLHIISPADSYAAGQIPAPT